MNLIKKIKQKYRSYSYFLERNKDQKLMKYKFINNVVVNLLLKAKNEIPEININKDKKFPVFFIDSNFKKKI